MSQAVIEKAKELLPTAGRSAFNSFSNGYNEAADQHSPSREMMKSGRFTMMGLAQGLTNNVRLIDSAADSVGISLMNEFHSIIIITIKR